MLHGSNTDFCHKVDNQNFYVSNKNIVIMFSDSFNKNKSTLSRKLISFNMVSIDGYFEGINKDISWHKVDEEVNQFNVKQLKTADTLIFGRKTFEVMETFWPTKKAFEQDKEIAELMSNYSKIVCSTTRETTTWNNTGWLKSNIIKEIKSLKQQSGKDLFVLGSAELCKTLIKNNMIDEFRLIINPVTLGKGNPFFHTKMNLQLLKTKVFGNGNVLLCYR